MDTKKLNFKLDYVESSFYVNTLKGNYLKVSIIDKECTNGYSYDVSVIPDNCSLSKITLSFFSKNSKNYFDLANIAVQTFENTF